MKKFKIPKDLGSCVDLLYQLRDLRLQVAKEEATIKAHETGIKEHLLKRYKNQALSGARGRIAGMTIDKRDYPSVKNWKTVYAWIAKRSRWDLLRKQLNDVAWREMHAAGKELPGVEVFTDVTFSITKLGGKKK